MNIEVANRLQQLRKAKGLSQEELANILGLSRQAISKWERAETSPDTDNLICLARLYNISIDKLLDTSESTEEIKERIVQERIDEVANRDEEIETVEIEAQNEVQIRKNIELNEQEQILRKKAESKASNIGGSLVVFAIATFFVVGLATDDWSWSWAFIVMAGGGFGMIHGLLVEHKFPVFSFFVSLLSLSFIIFCITDGNDKGFTLATEIVMLSTYVVCIIVDMIVGLIFSSKNRYDVEIVSLKSKVIEKQNVINDLQKTIDKYKGKYGEFKE